jgi:hypothetical protein
MARASVEWMQTASSETMSWRREVSGFMVDAGVVVVE